MGEATEYYINNYLPMNDRNITKKAKNVEVLSEKEINQRLEQIEKSIQNHNISFVELQNLITEKRTLLKILGKDIA